MATRPRTASASVSGVTRDHERTHPRAQRRAAAEQAVPIADAGERADTQLGQMERAVVSAAVEFLDVEQHGAYAERRSPRVHG
jgi:hypothetical protein